MAEGAMIKRWGGNSIDDSTDNPNNSDPAQPLFGGSHSGDEMPHPWIAITHIHQQGCEKIGAENGNSALWPKAIRHACPLLI